MSVTAIVVDSREPKYIQDMNFGGVPTTIMMLDSGDLQAVCDDGCILTIERKTPDDLLNTLRDERLFPQLAHLVQPRLDEQANSLSITSWPYLMITGELRRGPNGKVITQDRGLTGWDWDAVQGALLTAQEMGVMIILCGETDYEQAILRLGKRSRGELRLLPPRVPNILGPQAALLTTLPGIGIESTMRILEWAGGHLGHALSGLTDLSIENAPVGMATRRKIRGVFGLRTAEQFETILNINDDEVFDVLEKSQGA
jgi:ERCC4-type nuclease